MSHNAIHRSTRTVAALLLVGGVLLAGCGSSEKSGKSDAARARAEKAEAKKDAAVADIEKKQADLDESYEKLDDVHEQIKQYARDYEKHGNPRVDMSNPEQAAATQRFFVKSGMTQEEAEAAVQELAEEQERGEW